MDPTVEHLHRLHQEQTRSAPNVREWIAETLATILLLGICAGIAILDGWHAPNPLLVGGFILLYAAFWQVTFEIGPASTTPMQVVFVPLWFAVDPALLPLVVAGGNVLGNVVASARAHEKHHWGRVFIGIPDAWCAVGPALVLAAFNTHQAQLSEWWVCVLALAAQFVVDGLAGMARGLAAADIRPRDQVQGIAWMAMVDAALTPIGFVVALSLDLNPVVLLSVVPLAALLAQFAKERDDRIVQALELSSAYRGTAQLMGDVLEADDAYTGGEHTQGVVELSLAIGRTAGLNPRQMRTLEFGALLHDIGKLRVPNEIINKPGKLTAEEWAIIKEHPRHGQEMLDRVGGELSHAGRVVRAHHERWDGAGYPDGLVGEDIPIEARIITVCDSFSAMTTDRSYRKGMSHAEALVELERCTGSQFDPRLVELLHAELRGQPRALAPLDDDVTPKAVAPELPSQTEPDTRAA